MIFPGMKVKGIMPTIIYEPISDGDYVVKQTVLDADGNVISEHIDKQDEDGKYKGEKCDK